MTASTIPAPTFVRAGVTADFGKLRVVDAQTGLQLDNVIEADAVAGRVVRRDLCGAGNLQIVDGKILLLEEEYEIRIEWIPEAPAAIAPAADPDADEGDA